MLNQQERPVEWEKSVHCTAEYNAPTAVTQTALSSLFLKSF